MATVNVGPVIYPLVVMGLVVSYIPRKTDMTIMERNHLRGCKVVLACQSHKKDKFLWSQENIKINTSTLNSEV